MRRAVILSSYIDYPLDIPPLLREGDLIICLDGGYDIAKEQGLDPDILLGDFDSLASDIDSLRAELDAAGSDSTGKLQILQYPPEKDYTDLELALKALDPKKYPDLLIVGGMGGRLDHTLMNMQLMASYSGNGGFSHIEMIDGRNRCFIVHGCDNILDHDKAQPGHDDTAEKRTEIKSQPDSYLSLIPISETCEGVSLTGVKYPLRDATLHRERSLTVSNEFVSEKATLTIRSGSLLVTICGK